MSGASTSRPGPTTAAGGLVITWDRPAMANVARSIRLTTPIGRRHRPARLRRFRRVRMGVETYALGNHPPRHSWKSGVIEAVLLEPVVDRLETDAEELGRRLPVSLHRLQGGDQELALDRLQPLTHAHGHGRPRLLVPGRR